MNVDEDQFIKHVPGMKTKSDVICFVGRSMMKRFRSRYVYFNLNSRNAYMLHCESIYPTRHRLNLS